jgi:two-component system CheB/CheR fusion protein
MLPHPQPRARPLCPELLSPGQLTELLRLLAARTGVDLAGQRRSMLARRASHRLGWAGVRTPAEYLDRVRTDPAEPWRLLERLTIKVSRFFRNPDTFDALRRRALPELRRRRGGAPLRVWSAGCANGQEAYSLGMLCAEAGPFSVLGTDVDRAALARASAAVYPEEERAHIPAELAERHLVASSAGRVAVHPALARRVSFARHDLASDAPPPGAGFDLVSCRNVLIYFVPERQAQILARVAGRVVPGGYLVLGEAEWPAPEVERRLEIVDRSHRIFRFPATDRARSV